MTENTNSEKVVDPVAATIAARDEAKQRAAVDAPPPGAPGVLDHSYSELLPSKGVLYLSPDGAPLLPEGKIKLRPFTTKEESILMSTGPDVAGKIAKMINLCIVDLPFDPAELLVVDRLYILLSLRVHSFGGQYEFSLECQSCGQKSRSQMDIAADLDVEYMDEGDVEPFHVTLRDCKRTIGFRLMRGKDEQAVAMKSKRTKMRSNDNTDSSFLFRLAMLLQEIDGEPVVNRHIAEQFIGTLSMRDSQILQRAMEKAEKGVDNRIVVDCSLCGNTNEMGFPMDLEFFRPTTL